ncbi:hypothetical protein ACIA5A_18770 [Micromonospora sp. NPDC051300]|uniref:hypothetical protein n=1 Tax=Micromonospora sp. NPDC051300 TaxID=3364286 RepID=UPI00379F10F0
MPAAAHLILPGEAWEYQTQDHTVAGQGPWAISNTLDVRVTVDQEEHLVRAPQMYHLHLPNPSAGVAGNVMISGLTVVRRAAGGGVEQETVTWQHPRENAIEPMQMQGVAGVAHSEFQFFLGWTEAAVANLCQEGVLAVIFEAYQTNTPCASCQKLIGSHLVALEQLTGKTVLFRGRARQIYESTYGRLGAALHRVHTGLQALTTPGPPHVNRVLGVHLVV